MSEPTAPEQHDDLPALFTKVAQDLREHPDRDLVQALADAFVEDVSERHGPKDVAIPTLTDAHIKALSHLPEVFAKVKVTEPRRLTHDEIVTLIDERETIDTLLGVLKKRKDETLRENLAYHLDRVAEDEEIVTEHVETNDAGHYLIKQDLVVDGTGKKVQAIVSEGKPVVDSARLEDLHRAGLISRADYLQITSPPAVTRVFDAEKARRAILKDPSLLAKIAQATKKPKKTLTIKVAKA